MRSYRTHRTLESLFKNKPKSKKMLAQIEALKRRRGIRDLAKRFLIVCEDDKSAPNYFLALKKHFNLSATSIEIVGSGSYSQPNQVVEKAIKLKREAANPKKEMIPFDRVWCVIDGDYGEKIPPTRNEANKNSIQLAISTMCFEYWILLHFEDNDQSTHDCDGLVSTLRKNFIPGYNKGTCKFDEIVKSVREASRGAEKLRQPGIDRGDAPEDQNPCSEVYKLIQDILGNIS